MYNHTMSGHNKWSKIKHKKAGVDAQKSKLFGKIAKLIAIESKRCDGNRNDPGLKAAVDQARAANLPSQNIDRAVERGANTDTESLETITYELYGPGGCAILINTLTDNKNRTAAEIRHIVTKNGCVLSSKGSASWIFNKQDDCITPTTMVTLPEEDQKKLETLVTDLCNQEDVQEVVTNKA